mmetsp:Transcript_107429/g.190268  ORF Transcript_107429/g.190268 Transcript_107429/m.190268 type:complete len:243 (+) Transcript_107429:23-751(+)
MTVHSLLPDNPYRHTVTTQTANPALSTVSLLMQCGSVAMHPCLNSEQSLIQQQGVAHFSEPACSAGLTCALQGALQGVEHLCKASFLLDDTLRVTDGQKIGTHLAVARELWCCFAVENVTLAEDSRHHLCQEPATRWPQCHCGEVVEPITEVVPQKRLCGHPFFAAELQATLRQRSEDTLHERVFLAGRKLQGLQLGFATAPCKDGVLKTQQRAGNFVAGADTLDDCCLLFQDLFNGTKACA